MNERLDKIFNCVAFEVSASGGDGSGTVIFKVTPITEVAKAFEEWKAVNAWPQWLSDRVDYNVNHVLFTDRSNENIVFVSKAEADAWQQSQCFDEIRMEVW